MRIYIISNDGIALSGETPTALNEGEIVVASNEELHAARSAANSWCHCGTLCRVSRNARRSATVQRWSTSCGRPSKPCRTRSPGPM